MGKRERTLIVSHDPGLTGQIRGAIQVLGGEVLSATAADRALADVSDHEIDLVIAATELPGTDGYELCKQIKDARRSTKIMLVHPAGDAVAAKRCTEAGADATITRPVRGAALTARLEALVGKAFFLGLDKTDDSLSWPRAADSIIDPMTGVFPPTQAEVIVDETGSWASSVVSAAIQPLDDEELPSPDATQDLPEMALEEFDEEHPVSVPVDAGTTAHFKPVGENGAEQLQTGSQPAAAPDSTPNPEDSAFLPAQADLDPADELPPADLDAVVRAEIDKLVAPGGRLAQTIEDSVASAVASAMEKVLPALVREAARMASGGDEGA